MWKLLEALTLLATYFGFLLLVMYATEKMNEKDDDKTKESS